jgi:hypothetical protein
MTVWYLTYVLIWYIIYGFGTLYQEKSGSPVAAIKKVGNVSPLMDLQRLSSIPLCPSVHACSYNSTLFALFSLLQFAVEKTKVP